MTAAMPMPTMMPMPMMGSMMPMTGIMPMPMTGGMMMPMAMMMCKMTCSMTPTGMKCEMTPMDESMKDMFMECRERMMTTMGTGMPMMAMCGGMTMMCVTPGKMAKA